MVLAPDGAAVASPGRKPWDWGAGTPSVNSNVSASRNVFVGESYTRRSALNFVPSIVYSW